MSAHRRAWSTLALLDADDSLLFSARTSNVMFDSFGWGVSAVPGAAAERVGGYWEQHLKYRPGCQPAGAPGLAVHMENLRAAFCSSKFRKTHLLWLCCLTATGIDSLSRNSSPCYSPHSHLCHLCLLLSHSHIPRINRYNSCCQLPGTTAFANKCVSGIAECRVVWIEKRKFKISRYDEC